SALRVQGSGRSGAGRGLPFGITVFLLLAACAPPTPATERGGQQPGAEPAARKTIVFGAVAPINAFSLAEVGSGSAGRALTELWLQGLVTSGMKSQAPEPRIAAEMPTMDRGTMRIEPDGSMVVTWKLRNDVKWAD